MTKIEPYFILNSEKEPKALTPKTILSKTIPSGNKMAGNIAIIRGKNETD